MTIGSSISSRFVTIRTCSKETVLSSMNQLVHSKTAKSCLNEVSRIMNRFMQFTEMIPLNRTILPRIRFRWCAHAQSSSTIAVWLARLVARVWSHCQEIGWILIWGQVKSFFIYINQPNCARLVHFLFQFWRTVPLFPSFCWEVRVYRGIVCVHLPVYINFIECESRVRSHCFYSHTRVALHAHFDTS